MPVYPSVLTLSVCLPRTLVQKLKTWLPRIHLHPTFRTCQITWHFGVPAHLRLPSPVFHCIDTLFSYVQCFQCSVLNLKLYIALIPIFSFVFDHFFAYHVFWFVSFLVAHLFLYFCFTHFLISCLWPICLLILECCFSLLPFRYWPCLFLVFPISVALYLINCMIGIRVCLLCVCTPWHYQCIFM